MDGGRVSIFYLNRGISDLGYQMNNLWIFVCLAGLALAVWLEGNKW